MPAGRATNEPNNYFAFGFQPAKDTEASTFTFLRHLDGTGADAKTTAENLREGGDGQEVGTRYKREVAADGQMVVNARPEAGIRLALAALGADIATTPQGVGTSASGLANEHLAVATTPVPYMTLEQRWADEIERVTNAKITGFDLEWEAGRPLKITAAFVGGGTYYQRDVASTLTPSRETGPPFMYPGASVSIDGAGSAKVTKGKISVKRNVDTAIHTNALSREDAVELNFDTDIALTLKYEDRTLHQKVQYGGGSMVPVDLATGSLRVYSQFGSGTALRYWEVGVNTLHYTDSKVNRLNPDGQTMYIDVSAMSYKNPATNSIFVRALIASQAAIL